MFARCEGQYNVQKSVMCTIALSLSLYVYVYTLSTYLSREREREREGQELQLEGYSRGPEDRINIRMLTEPRKEQAFEGFRVCSRRVLDVPEPIPMTRGSFRWGVMQSRAYLSICMCPQGSYELPSMLWVDLDDMDPI